MFIVGLTGGLGTGKSSVLNIFKEHGVAVIDADQIARNILEPGTHAWNDVVNYFGREILLPDNSINRTLLGVIAFNDIEKRRKLNSFTHSRIQKAMLMLAIKYFFSGHRYVVMEVPLLFETGRMLSFMHKIITVYCEDHQQITRVCRRNGFSSDVALLRINSQMPISQKIERSHYVIDNSDNISHTRNQTENIMKTLNNSKFTWYFRAIGLILLTSAILGLLYLTLKCFRYK